VRPRRQAVAKLLRQALGRGELRKGTDPDLSADLLVVPQFLQLLLPLGLPKVPSRYPEALVETIWHGIPPAEPTSGDAPRFQGMRHGSVPLER
jgi:tetracycline repressor-like protein